MKKSLEQNQHNKKRLHSLDQILADRDLFRKRYVLALVLGPPGGLVAEKRAQSGIRRK